MAPRRPTHVALSLAQARAMFKQQALLPVKDALGVIHEAQRAMHDEPNVAQVRCPIGADAAVFVIGDVHGQFFDLMRLLDELGVGAGTELRERDVQLVFLGDYVDRGAFSCEVMLYLLLLKARFPTKVWLLRGNHECESISSFYGFRNECRVKYGISAYYHFLSCFQAMPVAALVHTSRGRIFCVHGGISPEISDVSAIDALDRKREVPTVGPLCDLLWSDPAAAPVHSDGPGLEAQAQGSDASSGVSWRSNLERGCSFYFSARALFEFLARSDLLAVVRAHEFEEDGFMFHFDGPEYRELDQRACRDLPPLMTVFSAPNYCDTHGNKGAYLVIRDKSFRWEMKQIEAAAHPAPLIASTERSADMWRQFNQTLPFLPASNEFFDEVVRLSGKQHCPFHNEGEGKPTFLLARQADPGSASIRSESPPPDSQVERKRRLTSEMHPQAIRRVLDDEVHKWMQSDEGNMQVFPPSTRPSLESNPDEVLAASGAVDDRSSILTQQELDMVKLMFSLMDTDGRLVLSADKVTRFVLNILGAKISDQVADNYLRALDFDGNGVVDFSDVLSWVATMKSNYCQAIARENESSMAVQAARTVARIACRWLYNRLASLKNARRTCLWLTLACLLRDLYTSKRHRLKSSPVLRFLGSITAVLYAISLLRAGNGPESPLRSILSAFRRRQNQLPSA